MDRVQAMTLLKELIALDLVDPSSFVNLQEDNHGEFTLMIKGDYDTQPIRQFVAEKGLTLTVNKEKGYCIISKL